MEKSDISVLSDRLKIKQVEDFRYNDIILYAKGWYKRTDIVKDLAYLFRQVYGWADENERDIAHKMLRVMDRINEELKDTNYQQVNLQRFYDEVHNYVCLYKVSFDMGIILWSMNQMMQLGREHIKLNPPHYGKKEHFRMNGKPSMTYAEMNRIASKMFNE